MATLTVQDIVSTGLAPTFAVVAAGGDQFPVQGGYLYYIEAKNTDGTPHDVIINSQALCSFSFDHNITVSIPATTGDRKIALGPISRFTDASGNVLITYSADTGMTIGIFRQLLQI